MATDGFAVTPTTDSATPESVEEHEPWRCCRTLYSRHLPGTPFLEAGARSLPEDEQLPLTGPRRRKPARAFVAQLAGIRAVGLFCAKRRDGVADGLGSRADNLDSIVVT
jgi:hypothetical protein